MECVILKKYMHGNDEGDGQVNKQEKHVYAALLAIILFVPGLHGLFSVTTLAMPQIAMIVVLAILPTICIQIIKMWQERR